MSIPATTKVSLEGRKFSISYNAVRVDVEKKLGRVNKSQILSSVASSNSCNYLLSGDESGDHTEFLFVRQKGVSFVVQIENYILASQDQDQDLKMGKNESAFVVFLDQHAYIADISQGIIEDESVLASSAAKGKLDEIAKSGKQIYCFQDQSLGSRLSINIEGFAILKDFELLTGSGRRNQYVYQVLAILMLRKGLFHIKQALYFLPPVIVIAALGFGFLGYKAEIAEAARALQEAAKQEQIRLAALERNKAKLNETDFSGATNLRDFISSYNVAQTLLNDGATKVEWTPNGSTIIGKSERLASNAKKETGWEYVLVPGGWRIVRERQAVIDNRRLNTISSAAVSENLFGLDEAVQGDKTISRVDNQGGYTEIDVNLAITVGLPYSLGEAAKWIENYPYQLSRASCEFTGWQAKQCTLDFGLKYESH